MGAADQDIAEAGPYGDFTARAGVIAGQKPGPCVVVHEERFWSVG
jgi:hypothetical protein